MPTPTQEFYRVCRDLGLGGPFTPSPAEAKAFAEKKRTFDDWVGRVRRKVVAGKVLPDIQLSFLDDGRFNGIATYRQGVAFIGLTRGTVGLPYDLFHRMLSHPDILPEVGNPTLEQQSGQHTYGIFSDCDDIDTLRGIQFYSLRNPIDPVRRAFAKACVHIAADFLSLHEIAHISHGHVQPQSASARPFIVETALARGLSPSDAIHIQALEMDADSSAASMTFAHLVNPNIDGEKSAFLWAVAMTGLFHIWGMALDKNDLQFEHPPTALRYAMVLGLAHTLVLSRPHPASDPINKAIELGALGAWRGMPLLGSSEMPERWEKFRNAIFDPAVAQHKVKIMAEWDRIRDQLEASSCVGVTPKRTNEERKAQEDAAKQLASPTPKPV